MLYAIEESLWAIKNVYLYDSAKVVKMCDTIQTTPNDPLGLLDRAITRSIANKLKYAFNRLINNI
jgi:hypothetical protein